MNIDSALGVSLGIFVSGPLVCVACVAYKMWIAALNGISVCYRITFALGLLNYLHLIFPLHEIWCVQTILQVVGKRW